MEIIDNRRVITMVCRALNLMDERLVNHGLQTAHIMRDMLEEEGMANGEQKNQLCIMALFHDIGAYRTEEVNRLIQFDAGDIWEHSIYGYLFLKEFAPFGALGKVVLYHHADSGRIVGESAEILRYAQMMRVADRVEVWHRNSRGTRERELLEYLRQAGENQFSGEAVECFARANEKFGTFRKLEEKTRLDEIVDYRFVKEEIRSYLWMLVHAIDFRSRFTVTHTVGVAEIGRKLAQLMGLSEEKQNEISCGAMLHDLGKIGTPVSILEKAGKLTDEEMEVMKEHIHLSKVIIEDCVNACVQNIALRHHEKLNGMGYPLGLTGEDMTLEERILVVADIVSALCMDRSYKQAFPKEKVLGILHEMAEQEQIDRTVLDVLESAYDEIVHQAKEACRPVKERHDQMEEEYERMLAAFRGRELRIAEM